MAAGSENAALAASVPSDWRRTAAFGTVLTAFVLEVADATVVNTALPQIKAGLGGGESAMQWIAAAYFLSLGSLLLIGGRLGDIFGYRRIFLCGVAAFVLASCFCGLARSAEELVAARLLQGAAGAVMAPQVMAVVQVLYDPLERVSRLAWFGVIGGLAAILGPVMGGILIEANVYGLGWRMIFLINLPVGMLSLLAAWFFIPVMRSTAGIRIDYLGTALFGFAFGLLLLTLIEGPELGWPLWCLASIVVSGLLFVIGWKHARQRQAKLGSAVIAPELFRLRTFFWGLATVITFSAASAGFLLIFAISLQQGLGLSALDTALQHIPFGLGVMCGISLIGRRYLPRFGRWLLVAGAFVMALSGCLALHRIASGLGSDAALTTILLFTGIGMGMLAGPLPPVIVADVDRAQAGSASALLKTAQQIGGAMGIALIGAAYFSVTGVDAFARLSGLYPGMGVFVSLLMLALVSALQLPIDIFGQKGCPGAPDA